MAKVKGTALTHVVEELRTRRDHVEALLPGPLRAYLEDRILAGSWYPEADFLALLKTMQHFVPKAATDPFAWMGRCQAKKDLLEIYSVMVTKGNAWATLQRFPRLWRLYHDTGKAEVGIAGENKAQILLLEYGFATTEHCRWLTGYLEEMLRQSGSEGEVKLLQQGTSARWLASW